MSRGNVSQIIIHTQEGEAPGAQLRPLAQKVSEFHAQVIERRLRQADLTAEQKAAVIDKILELLRSREDGSVRG